HVEPRVFLLLAQRAEQAAAERRGSVRKFQKRQRHQLHRQQLVIGEQVQQNRAALLRFQFRALGRGRRLPASREPQKLRPSRRVRRLRQGRPRRNVRQHPLRARQFFLQRAGEQNALGEVTNFHPHECSGNAGGSTRGGAEGGEIPGGAPFFRNAGL